MTNDRIKTLERVMRKLTAALGAMHAALAASKPAPDCHQPDLVTADGGQAAQPVAHVDGRSYRKKPVVVKAVQWTGENLREVIAFTDGPPETKSHHAGMMWEQYEDLVRKDGLKIYTLEGKMDASPGDWIIKGVKGESYPCKPDIFAATYESASQPAPECHQPDLVTADGGQDAQLVARLVEAAQWARNRLEAIADDAWRGDARDFKRSLVGVFADFDEALANCGSHIPPEIRTVPPAQPVAVTWPARCDGVEQDAFEAWAKDNHYDMDLHPLHWLFLNARTSAARDGWAAGLAHAVDRMRAALDVQPLTVQDAAQVPEIAALIEGAEHLLQNYLRDELDEPDLCVDDEHWSAIHGVNAALRSIAEGRA